MVRSEGKGFAACARTYSFEVKEGLNAMLRWKRASTNVNITIMFPGRSLTLVELEIGSTYNVKRPLVF